MWTSEGMPSDGIIVWYFCLLASECIGLGLTSRQFITALNHARLATRLKESPFGCWCFAFDEHSKQSSFASTTSLLESFRCSEWSDNLCLYLLDRSPQHSEHIISIRVWLWAWCAISRKHAYLRATDCSSIAASRRRCKVIGFDLQPRMRPVSTTLEDPRNACHSATTTVHDID